MLMKLKGMLLQHLVMKKMVLDGNREYLQLKEAEEEQAAACLKVKKELRLKEEEIVAKRRELRQVL
jgi:DNA-binding transcriptional MerR regulator